jgi:hypothetical protein
MPLEVSTEHWPSSLVDRIVARSHRDFRDVSHEVAWLCQYALDTLDMADAPVQGPMLYTVENPLPGLPSPGAER